MVCGLGYISAVDLMGWRASEAGSCGRRGRRTLLHLFRPSKSWGGPGGGSGVPRLRDSGGLCSSSVAHPLPLPRIDGLYLGDRQVGILSRQKNIFIYQVSFGSGLKGPRDRLSNAVLGYLDQYASALDACLSSLPLEGEQNCVMCECVLKPREVPSVREEAGEQK